MPLIKSALFTEADWKEGRLTLNTKSGAIYHYENVPKEVFDGFMAAESKGGFFNQNIKGKFSHKLV